MPTAPSEHSADLALLFDFDGTLYVGDLPILAFARHCADLLPDRAATALIDAIRFFLEGKASGEQPVQAIEAEDGFQAVETLGAAAGLTPGQLDAAYRRSRVDLAGSAFALEAPAGLIELLQELRPVHVLVATNADPAGVHEVLDSLELTGQLDTVLTDAGKPDSLPSIVDAALRRIDSADRPDRLIVVGHRWSPDLAAAEMLGTATALIDRFHRGDGTPTVRAADLAGLIPGIRQWAAARRATMGVR